MRLFAFRKPKLPITGSPSTAAGSAPGAGQTGIGIRQIGPSNPVASARLADVLGVDDQPVLAREVEHVAREREVLGPRRPERRHAAVDDAEREQPAGQPSLALHRVQVAR